MNSEKIQPSKRHKQEIFCNFTYLGGKSIFLKDPQLKIDYQIITFTASGPRLAGQWHKGCQLLTL